MAFPSLSIRRRTEWPQRRDPTERACDIKKQKLTVPLRMDEIPPLYCSRNQLERAFAVPKPRLIGGPLVPGTQH
jgi:hypothetical protein